MIRISNMKWNYAPYTNTKVLIKIMNDKFKAMNIVAKIGLTPEGNVITFSDVVDGKTFISSVDNKIDMKDKDPRIKKTGRSYLLSKRPTEEQYHGFFNVIHSVLDSVGLYGNVELIIPKTSETIVLRNGLTRYNRYPKMKSFPIKIEGGVNEKTPSKV